MEELRLLLVPNETGPLAPIRSAQSSAALAVVSPVIWKRLAGNNSGIFLHAVIVHERAVKSLNKELNVKDIESGYVLYGVIQMIKHDVIPHHYHQRYLLSDFGWVEMDSISKQKAIMAKDAVISYWKPEVAIHLVTDSTKYPYDHVPYSIRQNIIFSDKQKKEMQFGRSVSRELNSATYCPPIHADEIGLTSDKYVDLNSTIKALPLKITYSSMSMQRWLLMNHMEHSLRQQQETLGFTAKDLDDVRRLISDTSLYLLGVTVLASLLHLLFEFLAFQSDINFWKENKSLAGLSTRALITDLVSQIVILLFLIDSQTSLLVTIPSGIGIVIQIWKVQKATGAAFLWYDQNGSFSPHIAFTRWKAIEESRSTTRKDRVDKDSSDSDKLEAEDVLAKVTLEADGLAAYYLGTILLPLVLGAAARSLIYDQHVTWYSWLLATLTSCVYAGGFVLMCPQLFINHKLKSVSHLPWKFLCFKFVNTFIDDLFSFIIAMPVMHRLSVFRDDIVFFIYMYQRYIYKVDSSRPVEN